MSTNNYNSPASLAPEIAFKPDGFLGGMWAGQRESDYRQAIEQSNLMQALSAREELNKLHEYDSNSSVRESERLAKIAGFNADAATIGDIKGGQAATGRTLKQTQAGDVEQKLAKWRSNMDVDQQAKIDRQMANMVGVGENLFNTPGADTLEGRLQLDAQLKQLREQYPDLHLPETWSPEGQKKIFEQYKHAKTLQGIKQKEELAKTQLQSTTTLQAHDMDAVSREKVAEENRSARVESARIQADKEKSLSIQIGTLIRKKSQDKGKWTSEDEDQLVSLQKQEMQTKAVGALTAGITATVLAGGQVSPESIAAAVKSIMGGMVPSTNNNPNEGLPTSEAQWNAAWAALPAGQSMKGLDGKIYTKKGK